MANADIYGRYDETDTTKEPGTFTGTTFHDIMPNDVGVAGALLTAFVCAISRPITPRFEAATETGFVISCNLCSGPFRPPGSALWATPASSVETGAAILISRFPTIGAEMQGPDREQDFREGAP